jgi:hypothetical protein
MWWNSQLRHLGGHDDEGAPSASRSAGVAEVAAGMSEKEAFAAVCPGWLADCMGISGCCSAFRNFSLVAAEAVLLGQWGTVQPGFRGNWFMRDDRMGDVTSHLKTMSATVRAAALEEKVQALGLQLRNRGLWQSSIMPHLTDPVLVDNIDASVEYGVKLYAIIVPAWRVMVQGALYQKADSSFNKTELAGAIEAYDSAWAAYRAFGLAEFYAPSLYHPYYLCLGTQCNCAFDPPASDVHGGIGAAVDALRNVSGRPPGPPAPPGPPGVGEACGSFLGFNCTQGSYCQDHPSPDFGYSGADSLTACAQRCEVDASCTCFIHTDTPNPPSFAACKTAHWKVAGLTATHRGYSAYIRRSV